MNKEEKIRKIIKECTKRNFSVGRGLLNTKHYEFVKPIERREREKINKCFKEHKLNRVAWVSQKAFIIR